MDRDQALHLGIALPNYGDQTSPRAIADALSVAEKGGADSAWVTDHVAVTEAHAATYGNVTEALVTLGFAAGLTNHIRLGVSALVVPQREPVLAFKQAVSLDFLSGGRLILAVAVGWLEEEFRLLGMDLEGRGRKLDGWLEFAGSMDVQMPGPASHSGLVEMNDMWMAPAPPGGSIEMWSAGNSEAALRRAARLGIWHPVAQPPDRIAQLAEKLRGQRPDARVVNRLGVNFTGEPDRGGRDERGRPSITGPPEWIAEQLSSYVRAGCDGFIVMLDIQEPGLDERIERFVREVWPEVRRAEMGGGAR